MCGYLLVIIIAAAKEPGLMATTTSAEWQRSIKVTASSTWGQKKGCQKGRRNKMQEEGCIYVNEIDRGE